MKVPYERQETQKFTKKMTRKQLNFDGESTEKPLKTNKNRYITEKNGLYRPRVASEA